MEENKSIETNSSTEDQTNTSVEENNQSSAAPEETKATENKAAEKTEKSDEQKPVEAEKPAKKASSKDGNKSLHQQLLEAGVHFGHQKKKWNPKMLPYIFTEKKGIHIIDLNRTIESLQEAASALKSIARNGKKIMLVATKKQAKEIVSTAAQKANMPYVTERWLGGMLTNFPTIRKSVKKMQHIDKMLTDGTLDNVTKKERLSLDRSKQKMEKVLGGIAQMGRTPAALFIVDISHEHIALKEAHKLGITTFAMVDTNSDPTTVDFPIPANDDATKSISIITNYIISAIIEGLEERVRDKENQQEAEEAEMEEAKETLRDLEVDDEDLDAATKRSKGAKTTTRRRRISGGGNSGHGGRKPAMRNNSGSK